MSWIGEKNASAYFVFVTVSWLFVFMALNLLFFVMSLQNMCIQKLVYCQKKKDTTNI